MKRILFVIPFLSSGGAERVVSIWTSELARLGEDVHLLVFYRFENEYPVDDKVVIHVIEEGGKTKYNSLNIWEKLRAMRQAFKKIKPDIVLPFISYVGMMVSIAKIALPIKVIETIRNNPKHNPGKRISRWMRNISVFFAKSCIVQTKAQLTYFPTWMQKRMVVIPNPIANEFSKKEKNFTNKRIRNIIAVGRLEKQKNYPMLISAFSQIAESNKDINLNIYGEGSLLVELKDFIGKLNLQGLVLLCGRTNDMANKLLNSDLYILSSNWEGMPNALMEAMAVGLPCISTDCPTGPDDLIEQGISGVLIPIGDKEKLVEAMGKMIKNIDASIEMGRKARDKVISRYSASVSAKELIRLLEVI